MKQPRFSCKTKSMLYTESNTYLLGHSLVTILTELHDLCACVRTQYRYVSYGLCANISVQNIQLNVNVNVNVKLKVNVKRFRWSSGSVLAFGTQVRGFAPDRSRRIFRAKNILSTPSFGREVKPSVPCCSFTTCKRSLNVTW